MKSNAFIKSINESTGDLSQGKSPSVLYALVVLAIPTVLEQILSTLLQYVDTAMVGHLGAEATAAVSVTTTITWLIGSIASALATAMIATVSKSLGAGDIERAKKLAGNGLFLCVASSVIVGIICCGLAPFIPIWMGAEEAIRDNATIYFLIVSLPMPLRFLSLVAAACIRSCKDTKTPMIISISTNLLNVGLNWLLIYNAGLGVAGAALSTAISYSLGGICMYIAFRRKKQLHFKYKGFMLEAERMTKIISIAIPVLLTNMVSCLGYVFFAGMVSSMGTTVFAAHSIAVTAETLFYIPGYGLRTATSTLTGHALGENNKKKMKSICVCSITLTILMMFASGIILFFVARPMMGIFTPVDEVADLGAQMLRLVAFSEPFFGLMIVVEGIFYGCGRTKQAFYIEGFSMWFVRIFFTFIVVKILKLSLAWVWACMIADNVVKAILFLIAYIRFAKGGFHD